MLQRRPAGRYWLESRGILQCFEPRRERRVQLDAQLTPLRARPRRAVSVTKRTVARPGAPMAVTTRNFAWKRASRAMLRGAPAPQYAVFLRIPAGMSLVDWVAEN